MQRLLTPAQEDLISAAFLRHPDAITAWQRWRDSVNWDDHLDHGGFALLPQVYRNLSQLGADDPLFPRLKGIGRQAWLTNQQLIYKIKPILDAWQEVKLDAPLVLPPTQQLLHDSSALLNPKAPLSFSVHPSQAEKAIGALLDIGCRPHEVRLPAWSMTGYILGAHHLKLEWNSGVSLHLCWGVHGWLGKHVDELWATTYPGKLGRYPICTLSLADTLAFMLRQPITDRPFDALAEFLAYIAATDPVHLPSLQQAQWVNPPTADWRELFSIAQAIFRQWNVSLDISTRFILEPAAAPHGESRPLLPRRTLSSQWLLSRWHEYRLELGKHHSAWMALLQLPGYLMGRWQINHIGALPCQLLIWLQRLARANKRS